MADGTSGIDRIKESLVATRIEQIKQSNALQDKAETILTSLPKIVGRKNDYSDPKNVATIFKREIDGITLYTRHSLKDAPLSTDQIRSLAKTIKDEKASFETLPESDRDKIRSEFETSGNTPDNSFGNFLKSEVLGRNFEQPR